LGLDTIPANRSDLPVVLNLQHLSGFKSVSNRTAGAPGVKAEFLALKCTCALPSQGDLDGSNRNVGLGPQVEYTAPVTP
jgi:hypothetical protein